MAGEMGRMSKLSGWKIDYFFPERERHTKITQRLYWKPPQKEEQVAWSWVTCDDAYHPHFHPDSRLGGAHPERFITPAPLRLAALFSSRSGITPAIHTHCPISLSRMIYTAFKQ